MPGGITEERAARLAQDRADAVDLYTSRRLIEGGAVDKELLDHLGDAERQTFAVYRDQLGDRTA